MTCDLKVSYSTPTKVYLRENEPWWGRIIGLSSFANQRLSIGKSTCWCYRKETPSNCSPVSFRSNTQNRKGNIHRPQAQRKERGTKALFHPNDAPCSVSGFSSVKKPKLKNVHMKPFKVISDPPLHDQQAT